MIYIGRSIANYAAQRIITGSHKMSSIDHLHSETKIQDANGQGPSESSLCAISGTLSRHKNVCHHITTMDHSPREMKETLFTRHNQTVVPLLANIKKASLQAVHTSFVNTAIDNVTDNKVLNYRSPPINDEDTYLTRRDNSVTAPLRPLQAHPTALALENVWDGPVKTI